MLRIFKSSSELTELRKLTAVDPDLFDVHFAVKICCEMGYPDASVEAYAYCADGNTEIIKSLVMILRHKYTRAYITFKLLNNGTLADLESLLDKTSDILKEFNEYELHATRNELCEHISNSLSKEFDFSVSSMKSITLYISDEEQIRLQQKVVSLPDGFEFGELNAEKDADFVNQTWTIASAPDVRNTKSKITHLPNVAVRCKEDGKLVAFVMLFSFGALNHLYTVPEFRHKGIATAVQDKMFQKLLMMGIRPFWYSAALMEKIIAEGFAKIKETMLGRRVLKENGSDIPIIYDCCTVIRR